MVGGVDQIILRKIKNTWQSSWRVDAQGNRDNIDGMAAGSAKVLQQVLRLVDAHDLYGSVAYPKKHTQADISDIYRLPFATRGVFTNVALQEPFGLTVIEVSADARAVKDLQLHCTCALLHAFWLLRLTSLSGAYIRGLSGR